MKTRIMADKGDGIDARIHITHPRLGCASFLNLSRSKIAAKWATLSRLANDHVH